MPPWLAGIGTISPIETAYEAEQDHSNERGRGLPVAYGRWALHRGMGGVVDGAPSPFRPGAERIAAKIVANPPPPALSAPPKDQPEGLTDGSRRSLHP